MKKPKKKIEAVQPGRAWAWKILTDKGWAMCHWCHPLKSEMLADYKPSPEAKLVWCLITPITPKRKAKR